MKNEILKFCNRSDHETFKISKCNECYREYLDIISRMIPDCRLKNHKPHHYKLSGDNMHRVYPVCLGCHQNAIHDMKCGCETVCLEDVCQTPYICSHKSTQMVTHQCVPVMIGLTAMRNYDNSGEVVQMSHDEYAAYAALGKHRKKIHEIQFEGDDCVSNFIDHLKNHHNGYMELNAPREIVPAIRGHHEEALFKQETHCGYCGTFVNPRSRCFDHNHLTGKFESNL